MKLRVLDLFSGIGGFSLGLERATHEGEYDGFETVAFCEIEKFPRRVLAKHWPGVPCYLDVRELTASQLAADGIGRIDVITGGFPCQDISRAGKQAGLSEGTRSGLWSEIVRLAGELRPRFIIMENVANLLSGPSGQPGGWFGRVLGDLAECGYDAEWENIPAAALGAPHRRERIWLMAYSDESGDRGNLGKMERTGKISCSQGRQSTFQAECCCEAMAYPDETGQQGIEEAGSPSGIWPGSNQFIGGCANHSWPAWAIEPDVGRVAHGIPNRAHRIAGLGNAVIPQIPELIGNAILESINQ